MSRISQLLVVATVLSRQLHPRGSNQPLAPGLQDKSQATLSWVPRQADQLVPWSRDTSCPHYVREPAGGSRCQWLGGWTSCQPPNLAPSECIRYLHRSKSRSCQKAVPATTIAVDGKCSQVIVVSNPYPHRWAIASHAASCMACAVSTWNFEEMCKARTTTLCVLYGPHGTSAMQPWNRLSEVSRKWFAS